MRPTVKEKQRAEEGAEMPGSARRGPPACCRSFPGSVCCFSQSGSVSVWVALCLVPLKRVFTNTCRSTENLNGSPKVHSKDGWEEPWAKKPGSVVPYFLFNETWCFLSTHLKFLIVSSVFKQLLGEHLSVECLRQARCFGKLWVRKSR